MAKRKKTGLLPKIAKSGGKGTVKAADFFAGLERDHQAAGGASDADIADAIEQQILLKLKEAKVEKGSPEYREFLEGAASGARSELTDMAANIAPGSHVSKEQMLAMGKMEKSIQRLEALAKEAKQYEKTEAPKRRKEQKAIVDQEAKNLKAKKDLAPKEEKSHKASEVLIKKQTQNARDQGRILDLEMKQAKFYEKNLAKGEAESKVMFERTNKSLMHLLELQKKEQATITSTEKELAILKEIRDTLKEARGAKLEDAPKYKSKIDYLQGQYREQTAARGDMAAYAYGERIAKTAKGAFVPQPGLATKLGQHYKSQAAEWGSEVYEKVVPKGLRIIGEHVVGKVFGSKHAQKEEALNIARGRYDAIQGRIENENDGGNRHKGSRDQEMSPRIIASQTIGGQSLSNRNDMKIAELKVDRLIVLDHNLADAEKQKQLDTESDKHNTIPGKGEKKGGGGFLAGLMSLFGSFKSAIMGIVGNIVKIGASLMPVLSALLPVLAVVGAAIAGWKIGSWINDKVGGTISKAISKIDGSEDAAKKAIAPTTDEDYSPEAKIRIDEGRKARGEAPKYDKDPKVVGLRAFNPDAAAAAEKAGREMAASRANPKTSPSDAPNRVLPNTTTTPGRVESEVNAAAETPNIKPSSDIKGPQTAIEARTSMVVDASNKLEDAKTVRTAAPIVVNNVTNNNGGGKQSSPDLPISMGSARNQENGFMRYLLSVEAPM